MLSNGILKDCDLYSSTKCIFDNLKNFISSECIVVFDELVNYDGFNGENGELRAFYEFVSENSVDFEWIGMNGNSLEMRGKFHENAALIIYALN